MAPTPAGRQRGENRERVNQTLIENAEDDVDSGQRGQNEPLLVLERILEGLRSSLEGGVNRRGHVHLRLHLSRAVTASPRATLGARLKVNVTAGYWPGD